MNELQRFLYPSGNKTNQTEVRRNIVDWFQSRSQTTAAFEWNSERLETNEDNMFLRYKEMKKNYNILTNCNLLFLEMAANMLQLL